MDQQLEAGHMYPPGHPKSMFPLHRVKDAASQMSVSVSWLHAEMQSGRFPYVELSADGDMVRNGVRGNRRIRNDDLHQWIETRTVNP